MGRPAATAMMRIIGVSRDARLILEEVPHRSKHISKFDEFKLLDATWWCRRGMKTQMSCDECMRNLDNKAKYKRPDEEAHNQFNQSIQHAFHASTYLCQVNKVSAMQIKNPFEIRPAHVFFTLVALRSGPLSASAQYLPHAAIPSGRFVAHLLRALRACLPT